MDITVWTLKFISEPFFSICKTFVYQNVFFYLLCNNLILVTIFFCLFQSYLLLAKAFLVYKVFGCLELLDVGGSPTGLAELHLPEVLLSVFLTSSLVLIFWTFFFLPFGGIFDLFVLEFWQYKRLNLESEIVFQNGALRGDI